MLVSLPTLALANYGGMMGGRSMMWGAHTGGWGMVIHGFYSLLCMAVLVLFFWLLFRIARALEDIARAKKEE